MTIWNGITDQGAVVPIQVDAQGRVVVSGGGGVPSQVYGTAKASGEVLTDGSLVWGYNSTTSRDGIGHTLVSFNAPLPDASYLVVVTRLGRGTTFYSIENRSTNGFGIWSLDVNGSEIDTRIAFAVFNADPTDVTPLILPTSTFGELKALKSELDQLKKDKTR